MPATRPASRKNDGQSDPCPICQVRTARKSDMSRHMKSHDSYENKKYQCPYCEYRSSVKDAFKSHVNKHENRTADCTEEGCNAKFRDRSSLSRHRSRCHKGIKPKPRPKKSQPTKGPNWVNAYPKIAFVPQPAPVSSVSSISSPSETSSELDEELLTPPVTISPQQDMYAYSVMNGGLNLSNFDPASDSSDLQLFASSCADKASDSAFQLYNDISATSDLSMQYPNCTVTDFYGSVPREPYMTGALQDSFSFPAQSLDMGFADANTPLTQDGYATNGLFDFFQQSCLTADGLFPFQHQTTETLSSSTDNTYQSTVDCANPMDSFLQSFAQTQTSQSSNLVKDPLQDLDFSWFNQAPAPAAGYIF